MKLDSTIREEIIAKITGLLDDKIIGNKKFFPKLKEALNSVKSRDNLEKIQKWVDQNHEQIQWALFNLSERAGDWSLGKCQEAGLDKLHDFILSGSCPTQDGVQFKGAIVNFLAEFKVQRAHEIWEKDTDRLDLLAKWEKIAKHFIPKENSEIKALLTVFKYDDSLNKDSENYYLKKAGEKIHKKLAELQEIENQKSSLLKEWKEILLNGEHDVSKEDNTRFTTFLKSEDQFGEAKKLLAEKKAWNKNEKRLELIKQWDKVKLSALKNSTVDEYKEFLSLQHGSDKPEDSLTEMAALIEHVKWRIEHPLKEFEAAKNKLESVVKELMEIKLFYERQLQTPEVKKLEITNKELYATLVPTIAAINEACKRAEGELKEYESVKMKHTRLRGATFRIDIYDAKSHTTSDVEKFRASKEDFEKFLAECTREPAKEVKGHGPGKARTRNVSCYMAMRPWQKEIQNLSAETLSRITTYENHNGKLKFKCAKKLDAMEKIDAQISTLLKSGAPGNPYPAIIEHLETLKLKIKEFEKTTKLAVSGFKYGLLGGATENERSYIEKAEKYLETAKAELEKDKQSGYYKDYQP